MADQRKLQIVLDLVNNVSKNLKPVTADLEKTSQKMTSLGKSMTLGITAPLVLAGGAFVKAAADAEETESRFRQVFGDLSDSAEVFADDLGDAVGRSSIKIKDGLSTFQSFAVGMGFGREEAQKMAQQLQLLSIDFASFNNISDDEALGRFISALSGSAEVMDRFGVNIKASALDLELQAQGLAKSTMEATEQQKVIARTSIIMRAMTDQGAVGDAIRTQASFTNQMKRLNAAFLDFRVLLGKDIIPALTDLVKASGGALESFNGLSDRTRKMILAFAGLLIITGPIVYAVGKIIQIAVALRTAFLALRVASLALLGPWGILIAIVGTLATVLGFKLFNSTEKATDSVDDLDAQLAKLGIDLNADTTAAGALGGALGDLGDKASESAKKIKELREKALGIFTSIDEDEADSKRSLAESVIEQEEKVSDLKREIRQLERDEETKEDAQQLGRLRIQLDAEEEALKTAGFVRVQFANEIAEAERRAALTAFERQIEDIQKARLERLKDQLARLTEIQVEIAAEEAKHNAIQTSWVNTQAAIREETKATTLIIDEEAIKQAAAWDKVFKAASRAGGIGSSGTSNSTAQFNLSGARANGGPVGAGKSYLVGERGPEIFTPSANGGITANNKIGGGGVNITINGDVTGEDAMERLGEVIMQKVNQRIRLS